MTFAKLAVFIKDYFIALISFLFIFLLTVFIYTETKRKAEERSEKLFELEATQATSDIASRMQEYVQTLIAAKAYYLASDSIDRESWAKYYQTLRIEENYPGLQGLGFTRMLKPNEVEGFVNGVREEGFLFYRIRPEGTRPLYSAILFIEPFSERNIRAFGYDMYNEPIRRSAMQIARDTKQPAMSGKVRLMQETEEDEQAGFLIFLPVYQNNVDPVTIVDRQKLIKGFIYSPFRAKDLMTSILKDEFKNIDIEVYDGSNPSEASLLYSSDTTRYYQNLGSRPYDLLKTITIANNTWRVYCSAKPHFGQSTDAGIPYFILLGGSIISLLMFFVVWSLSNTRRSNRLKQTITDNATAALFMMDAKGYCTFMNPAAEEMTGYTLEEIKAKPLHHMIHHSHPDGSPYPLEECPIDRALPTNNDVRAHEDVFIRKDGTFFSVTVAARPILENGIPAATIVEVRDITDEKRARQAILESEERFRNMADSAPVMIWVADEQGHSVYVNRQWVDFTAQSYEQSINVGWQQMILKKDQAAFNHIYNKACAQGNSFRTEFRLKNHNRDIRWVVATGTPRFGAEGQFMGHIGSILDITEIKDAEHKIKQNAELLQKLFLEVPALVALLRAPDQQYVLANPLYRKIYGNRPLIGKTLREAHQNFENQKFLDLIEKAFKTGKPFVGKEVAVTIDHNNDGNTIDAFLNLVYQPMIDAKGKVEALLIFAVEVTELVEARKKMSLINIELSKKNKELVRINNDLDNFVYTASHDLKSPIANIEGLVTLLQDVLQEKLDNNDRQILSMVTNSIDKLKQTIADLAEITKVQKELQENVETLSFSEVLQDVQEDIRTLIDSANATITTDFQVEGILYARKNLRSILYNFVSNAVKYRSLDRPSVISIRTYALNGKIVLEVTDNGLGIKKEQQHKLFTMFKRLHTHVEGTGIGLYIVKRIIENNGGKVEVESELGQGTTFRVYFRQNQKVLQPA